MKKLNKEQRKVICNKIVDIVFEKCYKDTLTDEEIKQVKKLIKGKDLEEIKKLEATIDFLEKNGETITKMVTTLREAEDICGTSFFFNINQMDIIKCLKFSIHNKIHNYAEELGMLNRISKFDLYDEINEYLILNTIDCKDVYETIDKLVETFIKKYSINKK